MIWGEMYAMEKRVGWRLFLVTSLLLGAFIVETQGKCIMDLIFTVDESTSIRDDDFDKIMAFAKTMVVLPKLNVGGDIGQSRVGMITFSDRVRVHFELNHHNNANDIAEDIWKILSDGGRTATHLAVKAMTQMFDTKGRNGVAKVGLLITDGKPDNVAAAIAAVQKYKSKGYILFIIGVGSNPNDQVLRPLASKPGYYIKVVNYNDLSGRLLTILNQLCDVSVPTTPVPPTEAPVVKYPVDVVFGLGFSFVPQNAFTTMKFIIEYLIGELNYFGQAHGSYAGMITFNPVNNWFGLFDHPNMVDAKLAVRAFLYPVNVDPINLQMGFQAAHSMLMNGRLGARKVAVILIHNYTAEPITEQEANRLKADKVVVVIIDIYSSVDNPLLIGYASTPNLYFRITDPPVIKNIVPSFIDQIYRFDVGIAVDRTTKFRPPYTINHFRDITRNIIQYTRRFGDVGGGTLVGLLEFSTSNNTIFGISTHSGTSSAKNDAIAAVSGITADVNSTRNTHIALDALSDMITPYRVGAQKATILITNGEPDDVEKAQQSATALKNAGAEVSVIEFGPSIHNSVINLASKATMYYFYNDPSFHSFHSSYVINDIYGGVRITDVSIGLYRSNNLTKFTMLQNMAKHVLNDLPTPFGHIHGSYAGLVSFETSNVVSVDFGLNALPVLNDAVAAVDTINKGPVAGSKQTHLALKAMGSMLAGATRNANRKKLVALLITDCTIAEADPQATFREAAALKAAGYILVIIDIGSCSINLFCRDLASSIFHYVSVTSAAPQHYANLAIRRSHRWPYKPNMNEVVIAFDHCNLAGAVFQDMTSLAAKIVETIHDVDGAQRTLVSAGKFNASFTSEFHFYQHTTNPAIQSALESIEHYGGGLSLTAGLAGAASLLDQGRHGAKKIAIVMLCGVPSSGDMTTAIMKAQEMKTEGIIISVIEFCASADNHDLKTDVAYSPNNYYRKKVSQPLNSIVIGKEVAAQTTRGDVAIALDRTISIPPSSSFNDILDIVRYIIEFFPYMGDANWSATAFFEFSTTVNEIFGLETHSSPPWVPNALERSKADVGNATPDPNGQRNTHLAIDALVNALINGRPNASKTAILITGGDPSNITEMDKAISYLKDLGFKLLIIDFSSTFHPNLYKYVTNHMNYINPRETKDIPMSSAFIANRVMGHARPADFVIAMCHCNKTSTNSFVGMKSLAIDVLKGLPKFGQMSGSFAGFISFKGIANEEFGLDKYTWANGQTVQNAIQAVHAISPRLTGVKNTQLALMEAKTMLDRTTRTGGRKRNVVVLITDCNVADADPLATASGAAAIKAAGYILVVLDVGLKSFSIFCRDLASSPHHYILVSKSQPQPFFANRAIEKGFEFPRARKRRDMTIVFDDSNYSSMVFPAMKTLAVQIIGDSQFVGLPKGTLVSAGTFNTGFIREFDLFQYDNIPAVQSRLSSIGHNGGNLSLTVGLMGAADLLSQARPGSDKIAIVMLCGPVSPSDMAIAIEQSEKMKKDKITVAIIEFCNDNIDRNLRDSVAFSPEVYYRQDVKVPLSPGVIREAVEDQVSRIDMAIGLDRTIPIPSLSSFDDILQIVRHMIDFLSSFGNADGSLASFLQFSHVVNNIFGLNTHMVPPWQPTAQSRAKADVNTATADPWGNRNTHLAITELTDILTNGRSGASKVAVLITGGDPSNITKTDAAVQYMNNAGIELFIIDFSPYFHRSLYKYVKSPQNYINNNNTNSAVSSAANVVNGASDKPAPINVVIAMCNCLIQTPFNVMKGLTENVLRSLPQFGELKGTYAGLISFKSTTREEFGLETYTDAKGTTLLQAIQAVMAISPRLTGVKNTHLALLEAKAMVEMGTRSGVKGAVILISDCNVPDNKLSETVQAASAIKAAGHIVVVIDIGPTATNVFCRDLASSLSHYVLVSSSKPQEYFTNHAVDQLFVPLKIRFGVDIALSLDVSDSSLDSFGQLIAITKTIVGNLEYVGQPQGLLMGAGVYSDSIPDKSYKVEFGLYEYLTKVLLDSGLGDISHVGGIQNVTAGLHGGAEILRTGRIGAAKILIIFIYDNVSSADLAAALALAKQLKSDGFIIVVIHCAPSRDSSIEKIAYRPEFYFHQYVDKVMVSTDIVLGQLNQVDVGIAVDQNFPPSLSSHVHLLIKLLLQYLRLFGDEINGSLAGLLKFAETVQSHFGLTDYIIPPANAQQNAINAVDSIDVSVQQNGVRNTGLALGALQALLIPGRSLAKKVAILIMSGPDSNQSAAVTARNKLVNAGVELFVIDFTSVAHPFLRGLASSPSHYIQYNNPLRTPNNAAKIVNSFYNKKEAADFAIVFDATTSPSYNKINKLAYLTVGDLPQFGQPYGSHAAVVSYSTSPNIDISLNQYPNAFNAKAVVSSIQSSPGVKNTDVAIKTGYDHIVSQGTRFGSRRVVILITNCSEPATNVTAVAEEVNIIKTVGDIFVVACVGTDIHGFSNLASSPSHVVNVNTDELQQSANEAITRSFLPVGKCSINNGGCQHICTNTGVGKGYACSCRNGYVLNADNKTCTEVDECAANTHGCDHNCTNLPLGSYTCSCRAGYVPNADKKTCSVAGDKCSMSNGGCEHICTLDPGVGKGYTCSCKNRYQLAKDQHSCTDINECTKNKGNCDHKCTNNQGSYMCSCKSGFILGSDKHSCRKKLDVGIVIESVADTTFPFNRDTTEDIIKVFKHIGHPDGVDISIVQYASTVKIVIPMNVTTTENDAVSKVEKITPLPGIQRNTDKALKVIASELAGGRTDAEKVVILIASKPPADMDATIASTKLLPPKTVRIVYDLDNSTTSNLRLLASRSDLYFHDPHGTNPQPVVDAALDPDSGVCARCEFYNGVYVYSDLQYCYLYHQCIDAHQAFPTPRVCPFGEFFDPALLSCRPSAAVRCSSDPCSDTTVVSYPHHLQCSAYWVCEEGRTARLECCDPGFGFVQGTCVTDISCTSPCPDKFHPVKCNLRAVAGEPAKFQEQTSSGSWLTRDCALGTHFDTSDCQCSIFGPLNQNTTCADRIYLSFNRNIQDIRRRTWVLNPKPKVSAGRKINPSGAMGGGAARFTGNNRLFLQVFSHSYFGDKVVIRLRFLEQPRSSLPSGSKEMLCGNGDCGEDSSIKIMYDRANNQVEGRVVTMLGAMTAVVNVPSGNWKDVELRYDGKNLKLTVDISNQNSVTASGNVAERKSALQIGSGCNDENNFVGYIDEFYVYLCLP